MSGRPAVFLDRDGTLIEDRHYLRDPAGVHLLPGAAAAVRQLNAAGMPVIVVTNQSGIARGLLSEDDYSATDATGSMSSWPRRAPTSTRSITAPICPNSPGPATAGSPVPCSTGRPPQRWGSTWAGAGGWATGSAISPPPERSVAVASSC